jgi:hypothetical protein
MSAFSTFTVPQFEVLAAFFGEMEEGARGEATADAVMILTLARLTFADFAVLRGLNEQVAAELGYTAEALGALPEDHPDHVAGLRQLVRRLQAWKADHADEQRPVIDLMLTGSEIYLATRR